MTFLNKIVSLAADQVRVNARYLVDGGQRGRLREVLKHDGMTPSQEKTFATELRAAVPGARPYAGLGTTSLTLAALSPRDDVQPHLNLLIGELRENAMFAGIHTAVTVAKALAERLALPLRVIMLDFTSIGNDEEKARRFMAGRFDLPNVTVVARENIREAVIGSGDVWLATHSKTAHAAQVACDSGLIRREQVVYLIQDYEPGFSPWSTESVVAAATYDAGFLPIVNSTPLWRFLTEHEGLTIDKSLVIAPTFEEERLRAAAATRVAGAPTRVLFYARPSKHRNLYQLGVSALRAAVFTLGEDAAAVEFFSAGEDHEDTPLGDGRTITSLGRLPWDRYFEFLSTTTVMLSLQQSPHPSHPPFDAAISGAIAVTNEFHATRAGLHPRITAVPAETASLSAALVTAIRESLAAGPTGYLPVIDGLLGQPLNVALDAVLARLPRR